MNITESIILAFSSVKGNKLRASLTLLSIAIGVFAIIGSGALISSIDGAINSELEAIGETTFSVSRFPSFQMGDRDWHKYGRRKPLNMTLLKEFRRQMTLTDNISGIGSSNGFLIKSGNLTTNPDVTIIGADDNYFYNYNVNVMEGRIINSEDVLYGNNVAVVGNDVIVKLFPNGSPLGKEITIKNQKYTIVGLTEIKGAVLGQSQDNQVILPTSNFLKYFASRWEQSLTISVKAVSKELLNKTIDETIGVLRKIRNVAPGEENDFELETNETISESFGSITKYLSLFGSISGFIALIAAGVGIMNIMLVSVKERTREIGIRKAVGAKRIWILMQFIIEAITLCQIGGIVGIVLGMTATGLLSSMISVKMVFPVNLIIFSVGVCTMMGVVFGGYPAWKASKLDPIDALRYE